MRVLVVDDYPGAADITSMLFGLLGHEARGATTGTQALALIDELRPQIIVLDLGLPDMTGFDVAREVLLRGEPRPFLAAMTGSGNADERAHTLAAGFDMHVLKPASTENLTRIIAAARRYFKN